MLVGSPGRIWDVMQRCSGWLQLSALEVLVLDEADRLLDMGFKCDPIKLSTACKVLVVQSLAGPCLGPASGHGVQRYYLCAACSALSV